MTTRSKALLGWIAYACSATPFVVSVAAAFSGPFIEGSKRVIVVNAMIFAAAGVTAVLVKHMAFNLFMALNAMPYENFLVAHTGTDSSRWSAMDVEGRVAYVSIYAILGTASTTVWALYTMNPGLRAFVNDLLRWRGD